MRRWRFSLFCYCDETKGWIQRRQIQGAHSNLIHELDAEDPEMFRQSRGIRVSLHTVTIVNIPAVLCGKPRNVHTTTKYAPLCSTCVAMASIACWRKSLFLKSDDCTSYRQGKSGHSWTNLSSVNISFNNWFAISPKTT